MSNIRHCQQDAVRAPHNPGRCYEVADLLRPCSSMDLPSACVHPRCGTNDVLLLLYLAKVSRSSRSACLLFKKLVACRFGEGKKVSLLPA